MDTDEAVQRAVANLYDEGHDPVEISDITGVPVGLVSLVAAIGRAIIIAEYIEEQALLNRAKRRIKMCGRVAA